MSPGNLGPLQNTRSPEIRWVHSGSNHLESNREKALNFPELSLHWQLFHALNLTKPEKLI